MLDADFQPRTVTLDAARGRRRAAGRGAARSTSASSRASTSSAAACATTVSPNWMLAALRGAYRPGAGVAEAFATLDRSRCSARSGWSCSNRPIRPRSRWRRRSSRASCASPARTAALAAAAGERWPRSATQPQVDPQPDSLSLFHLDGIAAPIRRAGRPVRDRRHTLCRAAALVEEAEADPARFSPNVLLRPIVQDTLFPTICYVAGPSELAYLGQLRRRLRRISASRCRSSTRARARRSSTAAAARFLGRYGVPPRGRSSRRTNPR